MPAVNQRAHNQEPRPAQTNRAFGQALGRSRGGLTTTIHLAVDGRGLPLSVVLTPGNVNDCTAFPQGAVADRGAAQWSCRPRCRPDRGIADRAYSSAAIRRSLRRRGIAATIGERADRQAARARRGSRADARRSSTRPSTSATGVGRMLYQPAQAMTRDRHRARQTRPRFQGGDRAGHRLVLDQRMIHRTRPRCAVRAGW
ncbi:transposase [Actinomadura rubrobrunea]|uniref:transposase n=1 Tax=Actinomadura rubrobrunea TaxID=115335 RepID=UPI000A03D465